MVNVYLSIAHAWRGKGTLQIFNQAQQGHEKND